MPIHQLEIGNFKNYVYLIESQGEAYIVDPQRDIFPWLKILEEAGATLKGVLLTHSHWDHVAGLAETARRFNVPIYCHGAETHRLNKEPLPVHENLRPFTLPATLTLGHYSIEVLHTPGHSSGELCYLIKDTNPDATSAAPWCLLTGDTVFVNEVGRCDLDTGSTEQMFDTIQKLKLLPGDTIIYPGHNYGPTPTSTIAHETRNSPAFLCTTLEAFDALP